MKRDHKSLDELLFIIREEARAKNIINLQPQHLSKHKLDDSLELFCNASYDVQIKHVTELLLFDGKAFLSNAYLAIMNRLIDDEGLANYLAQLRQGIPKIRILKYLQASHEARVSGKILHGPLAWRFYCLLPSKTWFMRYLEAKIEPLIMNLIKVPSFTANHNVSDLHKNIQKPLHAFKNELRDISNDVTKLNDALLELYELKDLIKLRDEVASFRGQISYLQNSISLSKSSPNITAQKNNLDHSLEAFYVAFEEECRGAQDTISQQQRHWLNFLPHQLTNKRALDIGCGRGEWLAILTENKYKATGLDINPVMLSICQEKGLEVSSEDVHSWLKAQPNESLSVVTGFHVAEHVPFGVLVKWVTEIYRTLTAGGVLILETPNPENLLVGSHTFYHDPTHRNPLTPTLMEFLASYAGFARISIERLNPYPVEARVRGVDELTERVNGHLCGPQDFGLVAYKPG